MLSRGFNALANGLLIFLVFYALIWLFAFKVGLMIEVAFGTVGGWPAFLERTFLPLPISALASFLAHVGLRFGLKWFRLRLSTSELAASNTFLGLVTVLVALGTAVELADHGPHGLIGQLLIVVGAWFGVLMRRRIAI